MTLEALVGRRLMFGLPGPDLSDADVELFRETQAAGVMLYRRNFETPERLARLLTGLEDALGRRLLIATDHEGGRIIMLGRSVTIFPDNLAAGTAGEINFVHRQGLFEGRELRRLGVDVNFSPVLDVLTERYSPNIGIRSYGKDPPLVARYGAARIRGMQSAGVSACAKHFPGKGHAPLDAHLALPMIGSEWSEMHATHLPPFLAAIEAGVDCIMTSHPLYPRLDPAPRTPATFSRLIVEEFLRGEIGFRGAIVSDDRASARPTPRSSRPTARARCLYESSRRAPRASTRSGPGARRASTEALRDPKGTVSRSPRRSRRGARLR